MLRHHLLGSVCALVALGCDREKLMDIAPVKEFSLDATQPPSRPVACSPDGTVAVGTWGKVHVGTADAKDFRSFGEFDSQVDRIAVGPKGKLVGACAANQAIVWDAASGKEVARHKLPAKEWFEGIHFRPDGEGAFLLTHYHGELLAWNFAKNEVNTLLKLTNCKSLPDEAHKNLYTSGLAVIDEHLILVAIRPGLLVYDLRTSTDRFVRVNEGFAISALAPAPDGKRVAFNYAGSAVLVYDAEKWEQKVAFRFPELEKNDYPEFAELRYTRDGKYLVAAGVLGNVRPSYIGLFEPETGKLLAAVRTHAKFAPSLGLTPKDEFVVTAGAEGVKFWKFDDIVKRFKK